MKSLNCNVLSIPLLIHAVDMVKLKSISSDFALANTGIIWAPSSKTKGPRLLIGVIRGVPLLVINGPGIAIGYYE